MIFILSGLNPDVTEQSVVQGLSTYFTVEHVRFVREGDSHSPWAMVEVRDTYERVWAVTQRLQGVFHRGKALKFYIPTHQPEAHTWAVARTERIDID